MDKYVSFEICAETIMDCFDRDLNHSHFIEGHKTGMSEGWWITPSKGAIDQLIYRCILGL